MKEEKKYDVVIDVLQKHKDILWRLTNSNMNSEYGMGIMDDIRLKHIDDLERAIEMWQNYMNEWKGVEE